MQDVAGIGRKFVAAVERGQLVPRRSRGLLGPGSAQQHFVLQRVWGTRQTRFPLSTKAARRIATGSLARRTGGDKPQQELRNRRVP